MILNIYTLYLFGTFVYNWQVKEDEDRLVLFLIYLMPSLNLALIYQLSTKIKRLADFYGLTLIVSQTITLVAVYATDLIPCENEQVIS